MSRNKVLRPDRRTILKSLAALVFQAPRMYENHWKITNTSLNMRVDSCESAASILDGAGEKF